MHGSLKKLADCGFVLNSRCLLCFRWSHVGPSSSSSAVPVPPSLISESSTRPASLSLRFPPPGSLAPNKVDLQFQTNVLGHFHLVTLLLPLLLATPHSAQGYPRVMSTSSSGSYLLAPKEGICFDALKADPATGKLKVDLGPQKLYGQSKLV